MPMDNPLNLPSLPLHHHPRMASPHRTSPVYLLGLLLVTVLMLVLPCIYAGITALTTYGVYWFATHEFLAIWAWPIAMNRGVLVVKVLFSFTPLLVGGTVAFFMIKPFFARQAKRMQPLALDPAVEPQVYALVRQVCEAVGAPTPRRIELNCDVNASAKFDPGLGGFFGNRLILTLGMPLIAGLTQRELAGVIAHEFGHFRQGAGMRFSYLIRKVNFWFARVVYGRDGWDETLTISAGTDTWVAIMIGCARLGVGISRMLLWLLMMIGHSVSALLMRQMEYDADRSEIRLAGSAAFESTMYKLARLGSVFQEIQKDMARLWRRQLQLPDNLPVLLEYRVQRIPEQKRTKVDNELGLAKTKLLDTHPCPADRVRRARQMAEAGAELSDAPARQLFENFDTLSRLVTLAHYEDDLNVPITPDFLVPLEKVVKEMSNPTPPPPPTSAAAAPIPMLAYDPSAFKPKVE